MQAQHAYRRSDGPYSGLAWSGFIYHSVSLRAAPASVFFYKTRSPSASAHWYQPETISPEGTYDAFDPPEDIAFRHNLDLTLHEIKKDGAHILLVPSGRLYTIATKRRCLKGLN